MSLEISKIYQAYCPICDWIRTFNCKESIPDACPACGGDMEAFNKMWEMRKEKIHKGLEKDEFKWGRA